MKSYEKERMILVTLSMLIKKHGKGPGCSTVVERLFSMHEALGFIHSTKKKKKKSIRDPKEILLAYFKITSLLSKEK
jgi:hypothetical protein